jgi:hypothetical protein
MIRTVVYRRAADHREGADAEVERQSAAESPDSYLDRLLKFIPAECLALWLPLAAAAATTGEVWLLWAVLAAGLFATVLYLWLNGRAQSQEKQPMPHYYVLAALAFVIWAIGTSEPTADLIGLSPAVANVLLGLGVLLVPGLDQLLEALLSRKPDLAKT